MHDEALRHVNVCTPLCHCACLGVTSFRSELRPLQWGRLLGQLLIEDVKRSSCLCAAASIPQVRSQEWQILPDTRIYTEPQDMPGRPSPPICFNNMTEKCPCWSLLCLGCSSRQPAASSIHLPQ